MLLFLTQAQDFPTTITTTLSDSC